MMYATTEAAVYAIAGQRYVTTAGITLLKKSAFARGLVLVPVVVGILHVLLGQFTRNYTQTTKRGLLTTNKG